MAFVLHGVELHVNSLMSNSLTCGSNGTEEVQ